MGTHSHIVCLVLYLHMQEESHCITALGLACGFGHKAVAELLILKGAEVNCQDNVRLVEPSRVVMYCYYFRLVSHHSIGQVGMVIWMWWNC